MASTASSPGVALITGAAKGIGRAIALRLAKNGYDVGMNDLPTAAEALEALGQEIASLGRRSYIAIGDVSVPDSVENIVSSVVENLGHLDVMVANAGICVVTCSRSSSSTNRDIHDIDSLELFLENQENGLDIHEVAVEVVYPQRGKAVRQVAANAEEPRHPCGVEMLSIL
ncbi:hypothetical protein H0H81_003672 [Sphagnurus paluster]|uniref:Uncharacterized protein n=1 Tax=Sphagnurus paluster TaxID=117069 RepID=A0A9P7GG99_9AGAR|nr:hypothetical protein H0H81_003672 [Sphagnurus paluster]